MPIHRRLATCVFFLAVIVVAPARAQRKIAWLHGQLTGASSGAALSNCTVELIAAGSRMARARSVVTPAGSFAFQDIEPGMYTLQVIDPRGESIHNEIVNVFEGGDLAIRLEAPRGARPPDGVISARELAHPVPAKAAKEYVSAKSAASAGDYEKAFKHFERAVSIDPAYVEAWNDMGVAYMRQNRTVDAAECFAKAAAIEPKFILVQVNLSVAEAKLGHLDEAEAAARRAIAIDAESPRAQQALALSLALRQRANRAAP
jgi:tetratricopeptide (TPR) repeat protein